MIRPCSATPTGAIRETRSSRHRCCDRRCGSARRLPVETQYAAACLLKRATENVALRLGVSKTKLSLIDKQVEQRGAELDLLMSPGALLVET